MRLIVFLLEISQRTQVRAFEVGQSANIGKTSQGIPTVDRKGRLLEESTTYSCVLRMCEHFS